MYEDDGIRKDYDKKENYRVLTKYISIKGYAVRSELEL